MPHFSARTRDAGGFTLVELMIVVALVAILSAIALPNYTKYLQKGRRVDAKSAVLDLSAREERYFATNNKYSLVGTDLGYGLAFPMPVTANGTSYYTLNITQATTSDYAITATPTGSQTADACYAYTLNSLIVQGNANADSSINITPGCW